MVYQNSTRYFRTYKWDKSAYFANFDPFVVIISFRWRWVFSLKNVFHIFRRKFYGGNDEHAKIYNTRSNKKHEHRKHQQKNYSQA